MRASVCCCCCALSIALPARAADPLTVAERSGFDQTGRFDDVVAFMQALDESSDLLYLTTLGTTVEQRELPLAIIADPPVRSADEARNDERMTVLLFGNIHAGEVCGKEALQMLARELIQTPDHPLLENLIVAVVPMLNADGNERFSPDNRPGQVGPREMGQRPNAMGLDLNRDWIKLEAPETRAIVRFCNQWDPPIVVDTHTTNGSLHRYTLTYEGPLHPLGDRRIVDFVQSRLLPDVSEDLLARTGYRSEFYGNFDRDHTMWWAHPGQPRFGCIYRGMRNRIGILSEAYSYAGYEDRIRATFEFCRSLLQFASDNQAEIEDLIARADARTIELGSRARMYDSIPLRTSVRALPETRTILGYEEIREDGARPRPGKEHDYEVDFVHEFYGTRFAQRPIAYFIPPALEDVLARLRDHGVEIRRLGQTATVYAETYQIDRIERADEPFQGHHLVLVDASRSAAWRPIPAGFHVVLTAQPLGGLASYLLEPESDDGFVAWNLLDDHLEEDGTYPILRTIHEADLVFDDEDDD